MQIEFELLKLAVEGDRAATMQILGQYRSQLTRRVANRLAFNPFADFSAEDIVQEVCVDVLKSISSFDLARRVAFTAWLYRIADNRLAKTIRDRSRIKRGGKVWQTRAAETSIVRLFNDIHDEKAETGSARYLKEERKEAIKLCVVALPKEQREAIELSYLEQKSLDDIAETMNLTKNAVRGLLFRAKKTMREMMGESSRWL